MLTERQYGQHHIIGRALLEINTGQLADVSNLQEQISHLLHQQGIPAMAQLFEQLVTADEVVRLDRVVIDLGVIHPRRVADEFIPHLIDALNQTLRDYLANRRIATESSLTIAQNRTTADGEILLYFLQYGRLPWWVTTTDWQNWLSRWQTAMQNDTTWQEPVRELLNNPTVRQRLVAQLPENLRHQLLLQLQPTWIGWAALLTQAQQIIQALNFDRRSDRLNTQAWLLILAEIHSDRSPTRPLPAAVWTRLWLTVLIQTWQQETTPESSPSAINRQPPTQQTEYQPRFSQIAYQRLQTILTAIPSTTRTLWLTALDRVLPLAVTQTTTSPATPESEPATTEPTAEDRDNDVTPTAETSEATAQNQNNALTARTNEIVNKDELSVTQTNFSSQNLTPPTLFSRLNSRSSILSPEEETVGIYINQAGLVLLHPFLPIYLRSVGLVEEGCFRDQMAQERAVYLLYYLATQQTDAPEYELVLPKLLCGWSLDEAIAREVELPATALDEGEHLLQTAINYWQALKNTSPDGLREGFLQREGKLTRNNNGTWKLQIERQSIDILLSRLPWGLSVVKLPWMDDILIVDWI
ncbi:hypothetical protein F7734_37875 [Scytonema sp. UIC 10036]|uniref:contractile injection system tape measure protein n=1 Tax=Scytonema sp. UIC 10036 TaxID=2304196 RepID=UPI0012DA690B|nr:contractile injection system tape measure protein [Scytonema sp. UIC 10036]MUG97772.1 hypothetical protein [Scytonema sp. UIC 10036]